MSNDQEQSTDGIRDPVLRQLVEQFNNDMTVMTAYQHLALRRGLFEPVAQQEAGQEARERQAAARATWPQNVVAAAGHWIVQQILTQAEQVNQKHAMTKEEDGIIIDGSYRVVEETTETPDKQAEEK